MQSTRHLVAVVLVLCLSTPVWSQGRLSAVRDDVQHEEEKEEDSTPQRDCDHHHHDAPALDIGWLLFPQSYQTNRPRQRTKTTIIEEIKRPDGSIERRERIVYDDDSPPRVIGSTQIRAFPAHPYPLGLPGYMQLDPTSLSDITGQPGHELDLKTWSVRFSVEDGHNLDGLNRFNGTMLAETQIGLGLYTSWNWFREDLRRGYSANAVLGNITVTWRNMENEYFLLRYGFGAWIFGDDYITDAGINAHLSADIFPAPPWVVSLMLEGGGIGDTGIVHFRSTVGYLFQGLEVYGGYDIIQIGNTNLDGPLLGVRVWF